jgi:Ca2+-binding EF-hand superfamily protein
MKRAAELLRKFDMNEDEAIERAELLAAASPPPSSSAAALALDTKGHPSATLVVDLGKTRTPSKLDGEGVRLLGAGAVEHLRANDNAWLALIRPTRVMLDFAAAGDFIMAQFNTSLGSKMSLTKAELDADPNLSGLRDLFHYADRNEDGQLSMDELDGYLKLIDLGLRSQVWIKVTDLEQNPFAALDTDGDARLSALELARAGRELCPADQPAPKRYLSISFTSPEVSHWGGIKLPTKLRPTARLATAKREVPAWFKALDRNQDQVVSAREFLGPPEAFKKLDRDGDGLLTPEEVQP